MTSPDEREGAPDRKTPGSSAHLAADLAGLAGQLRGLAHDQLQLAELETRKSVHSLLVTMVLAIVTGLLLVSTWLGIVGAMQLALMDMGLDPLVALLLVVVANLLVAALSWGLVLRRVEALGWPRTLRAIRGSRHAPEGDSS